MPMSSAGMTSYQCCRCHRNLWLNPPGERPHIYEALENPLLL